MPEPKTLNFIALPKQTINPTLDRRARIVARLEEQKQLLKDPGFMRTMRYWVKDENGQKTLQEKKQRVLPCWRPLPNGGHVFFVRSGQKAIEFEKGKAGIGVPSLEMLPAIIDTLIRAVNGGQFDDELANASAQIQRVKGKSKR